MNISQAALEIQDRITTWRRDLHLIPEVDLELPQTSAYIQKELTALGIEFQTYEDHSGICAVIGTQKGKVIALRADMDGLPIKEENDFYYASQNGNMHACGHDAHMAILLGTAKILKDHAHLLHGQVKLIFQPGEENLIGAKRMVEQGVLDNPKVDALLALHVGNLGGTAKNGDIIVSKKNVFAASRVMQIKIIGRGGHASTPQLAVDPIVIGSEIIQSLQHIVSREVRPGIPAVVAITHFTSGMDSYNIIPETAEMKGGLRAADLQTWEYLTRRVGEIVEGISTAKKARGIFTPYQGSPPVINDKALTTMFLSSAKKVMQEDDIVEMETINMGGEDVAYFFAKVPGCYFFINNAKLLPDGTPCAHHNCKFDIDDSILHRGTALFCQSAIDFLYQQNVGA